MRVLGIDPGLEVTGYGALDVGGPVLTVLAVGVLQTAPQDPLDRRVATLHRSLTELLERLHPDVLVVEELYSHYKHPTTAVLMAHARGVILLACAQQRVPVVGYPVLRVRKAVTGRGSAGPEQVQRTVQVLLGLPAVPEPSDVADALALAITHSYAHRAHTLGLLEPPRGRTRRLPAGVLAGARSRGRGR